MKKIIRAEKGFTLIEMLVVLMIISVLLLIAIPNMTKNNEVAANKGCDATVKLLQAQVHAYEIETKEKLTSLSVLKDNGYVESIECPNGAVPNFNGGTVSEPPKLSKIGL
ncbi:competence protein ComGC [Halalkalibacter nanhaiisediminis]|uniref:Competence protein ComGC n=1 Tax=Halalkalibacter nanhaiisediminis TaxID=688079 RepID=A0A562QGW8_9BACI|nr:competence protein ComGC [Halalkalibacter nanhaiisediminis]